MVFIQRSWQAINGFVTIILIAHFLSPVQQGWYYSFVSLAALYTLFDLGLSVVLVQISAQLFVSLRWRTGGAVEGGHPDHFLALIGRSSRVYLRLALAFFLLVLPAGILFFGIRGNEANLPDDQWLAPWVLLIAITAAGILALPYLSLIEGSGRVAEAYGVRFTQGLLGGVGCWLVLALGGALWAVVMAPAMGLLVAAVWLITRWPALLHASLHNLGKDLEWRREIWPLQWRTGLSWLNGYLLTQIYTPILFHTQGAVVAGQMGLSLSIANMLGLLAQSWITQDLPAMTQAVATRNWVGLDKLFRSDLLISIFTYALGALAVGGIYAGLQGTVYAGRLLPLWPFVGLLCIGFLGHLASALAAQLRSYTREPLVWVSLLGTGLTVPAALWAAFSFSAAGVVTVILTIQGMLVLPLSILLWRKYNRAWRVPS